MPVSLASPKGPPRCQHHGTTSRPPLPADPMIPVAGTGVKLVFAGASPVAGPPGPR
jgi:hypothetical protein